MLQENQGEKMSNQTHETDPQTIQNQPPAVRPRVLANLLDVDPKTVKNWAKRGLIRVIQVGKEYRIPMDEVHRIMQGEVLNAEGAASTAEPTT